MLDVRKRIIDFIQKDLWDIDVVSLSRYKSFFIKSLRLLNVVFNEFTKGELTLRAMSLVYTTLLSIVPVLAISFSVLKAFGVHNEVVEPFLLKFLAPLGAKGEEITLQIINFVENMKVGVLGSLGLGMLIYTVISVIQKVENSFNAIWKIEKARSMARKFSDYISVMLIGPVLLFSALGLTATLTSTTIVQKIVSVEPFGSLFYFIADKSPYVLVCGAFTFLYIFIPNTKVKFKSALVGGIIAGILWETAGWAFASFVVTSTKYAAIYSGFAILIIFMIWLYLNWLILLVGAQLSFYHQYPYFISSESGPFLSGSRFRERLIFLIMHLVGYNYYHNKKHWTLESLVSRLELPVDQIQNAIALLEQNGLLLETSDDPPAYVPEKDIGVMTLREIHDIARNADKDMLKQKSLSINEVDTIIESLDNACIDTLGEKTLKDLVLSKK